MSIILSTIKNQYNEKITDSEVYFNDGKWYFGYINCMSSQDYGLGNCRCISHNAYVSSQISREDVKKYLAENMTELSDEERSDLLKPSLEEKIVEKFSLLGFTLEQVEKWAEDCYKIGTNPLPTIREHLKDICKVGFAFASNGASWSADGPTLVCWLTTGDSPSDTKVSFEICGE